MIACKKETEVVYKVLKNGKVFARPLNSFADKVKGMDGESNEPRFKLASEEEVSELLKNGELNLEDVITDIFKK